MSGRKDRKGVELGRVPKWLSAWAAWDLVGAQSEVKSVGNAETSCEEG